MLTIISGTNRTGSNTRKIAQNALDIAKDLKIDAALIDLAEIPNDFINNTQYSSDSLPQWLKDLQDKSLIPAKHFLIIAPEYNGSIPGYLKLFIDAISVHRFKECLGGKTSALVGIATGRAGNIRGLDHLTSIMIFNGCAVLPGSLPISKVTTVLDANDKLEDSTKEALQALMQRLVKT